MKRTSKSVFFIIAILILVFTYLSFAGFATYYGDNKNVAVKGVDDIRWGIDIQGGVEAVFKADVENPTSADMKKAEQIIKKRLLNKNITDSEVNIDNNSNRIIVRFPWQKDTNDFEPTEAVKELGAMAVLTFNEGDGSSKGTQILIGSKDIDSAKGIVDNDGDWKVQLKLTSHGKSEFASATSRLTGRQISIWLDDECISAPKVNEAITDGTALITGNFDQESANDLANTINAGSLPFALSADDSRLSVIEPTLGQSALSVMLLAGIIAYCIIVVIMILLYRVPGFVAALSITCQIAGIFAFISGFLPYFEGFTLTIPGIAGIILSIGMGVDANVINAERVKDEFSQGKTIDGAIHTGFKRGFGAIIDGNVTVVIVSVVLMGAFGPTDTIWSYIMTLFGVNLLGSSITGSIYSFGYTLLIGAIFNLVVGVALSRLMVKSLSSFKCLRKPWLFGGKKDA